MKYPKYKRNSEVRHPLATKFTSTFHLEAALKEIDSIINVIKENLLNNDYNSSYDEMRDKIGKLQFITKNVDYQFDFKENELSKRVAYLVLKGEESYDIVDYIVAELKKEELFKNANELWASYALKAYEMYKVELPPLTFVEQENGSVVVETGTKNSNLINLDKTLSLITNVDFGFFGRFLELHVGSDLSFLITHIGAECTEDSLSLNLDVERHPDITYKSASKNELLSIRNPMLSRDIIDSIENSFSKGDFEQDFLYKIKKFLTPAITELSGGNFVHNILDYYDKEEGCFNERSLYSVRNFANDDEVFIDLRQLKVLLKNEFIKVMVNLVEKLREISIFLNSYETKVREQIVERLYEVSF